MLKQVCQIVRVVETNPERAFAVAAAMDASPAVRGCGGCPGLAVLPAGPERCAACASRSGLRLCRPPGSALDRSSQVALKFLHALLHKASGVPTNVLVRLAGAWWWCAGPAAVAAAGCKWLLPSLVVSLALALPSDL